MRYITKKQASKIDDLMMKKFHIDLEMMMELAGYHLAEYIRDNFKEREVLICVGKGNNGGDGLCAARHLLNFGFDVKIFLALPDLEELPLKHLRIAHSLSIPILNSIDKHELVLDCLFGYNLKGSPRPPYDSFIESINENKKIISCDIPSGVDADLGLVNDCYVKATHIVFMGMPKLGCEGMSAKKAVVNIGVPKKLYPLIEVEEEDYFVKKSILKLN